MSESKWYEIIIEERSTFVVRCGGDSKADAREHALYLVEEYKQGVVDDEQTNPLQAHTTHKTKVVRIK